MLRIFATLCFLAAPAFAQGPVQALPTSPYEAGMSATERDELQKLRTAGESVYWVGSAQCLTELKRLAEERKDSAAHYLSQEMQTWRYSVEASVEMLAAYETDMYFARRRLSVIEHDCDKNRNLGDFQQTSRFLDATRSACSTVFAACNEKRHW